MTIEPTQFTRESARRIAQVVRSSELTPLPARPLNFERVDFSKVKVFRVGTFEGEWPIGTDNIVTFKNITSTPNTASVTNLFFPIDDPPTLETDCAIAKEGTSWYLVDVPLAQTVGVFITGTKEENVLATAQTSKITFFSTKATSQVSFQSGSSSSLTFVKAVIKSTQQMSLVTSVQASINTANCTISVTAQTENVTIVTDVYGTEETISVLVPGSTQTATTISMGSTQTAVILSSINSKSILVVDSTYTATYLRLGVY